MDPIPTLDPHRILAVVLARGGSRGIPRKNLRPFDGVPLVGRAIRTLLGVREIDRVVGSTDDVEIASVVLDHGGQIPFLRPEELARDETPSMDALADTVRRLVEAGERAGTVVLFQATSPGCTSEQVSEAIRLFGNSTASYLKSVTAVREHPHWMGVVSEGHFRFLVPADERAKRRQDLPPVYRLNGAVSVYETERILTGTAEEGEPVALIMDEASSVDIDTIEDWERAEALLTRLNRPTRSART